MDCERARAALAAAVAVVALFCTPAANAEGGIHLNVSAPANPVSASTALAWTEVKGFVWTGESPYLDVFIALDLSKSTLIASGDDIDGDGRVGRYGWDVPEMFMRPYSSSRFTPSVLSSDTGDTIAAAEFAAVRSFVQAMDVSRVRVGLLTYGSRPRVRARLTSDRQMLFDTLDKLAVGERRRAREFRSSGSNTGLAMATGGAYLLQARKEAPSPARRMQMLVLFDGFPNRPKGRGPEHAAATAQVLQDLGVQVHFFPLGATAVRNAPFFEFVDELTGSRHTKVGRAGEIAEKLAEARLDRVTELEVVNRTANRAGRGKRLFADGSFDAIVPLVAGTNEIVVRAVDSQGEAVEVTRWIDRQTVPAASLEDARARAEELEAFTERIRERSAETKLLVDLEAATSKAREVERRLRLEVESATPESDD